MRSRPGSHLWSHRCHGDEEPGGSDPNAKKVKRLRRPRPLQDHTGPAAGAAGAAGSVRLFPASKSVSGAGSYRKR